MSEWVDLRIVVSSFLHMTGRFVFWSVHRNPEHRVASCGRNIQLRAEFEEPHRKKRNAHGALMAHGHSNEACTAKMIPLVRLFLRIRDFSL